MVNHMHNKAFRAADHANDGKKHLLVAATGSVATIKIPSIVESLSRHNDISIRILLTQSAKEFLQGQSDEQPPLEALRNVRNVEDIYCDKDDWTTPWKRGDPILHIELRRWANLLLIAPLSANSLAKMSIGMADNLLLSVVRAWDTLGTIDGKKKSVLVACAMNTAMWRHPVTRKQLSALEDWNGENPWIELLYPVEKTLACGDTGDGAMREWSEIVTIVEERLAL